MAATVVIKQEFKKLAESTSIRGVSRVIKSSDKGLRVIWAAAVLFCLGILIWQTTTVCLRYYSRQSSTLFTQKSTKSVFPDITICNTNPLNNINLDKWKSYLASVHTSQNNWSCRKITDRLNINLSSYQCDYIWQQLLLPPALFATLPPFDEGNGDTDLITDCSFYDWDWGISDLDCYKNTRIIWENTYYKCYRIQVPTNLSQTVLGLTAVIYINDFSPTFFSKASGELGDTMSTGVKMAVHAPGTEPDLARGIDIGPGVETTVHLSMTDRRRLQSPYPSQCTDQNFVSNSSTMLYTSFSCYEVCIQRQIVEKCHCVSGDFLFTDNQMISVNNTLCGNMTSKDAGNTTTTSDPLQAFADLYCIYYRDSLDYDSCIDTCNSPCNEYIYDTSVSTSGPSPSVGYQMAFYQNYIDGKSFAGKFSDYESVVNRYYDGNISEVEAIAQLRSLNLIERNFVQLNVLFERINPYELTDTASMTIDNLWAQLGGVLSLWLGITIMTAVEVVECLYRLSRKAWNNRKARKTTQEHSADELTRPEKLPMPHVVFALNGEQPES